MAFDVVTKVLKLAPACVTPSERLVLLCLAWHANKHGQNAWPAVSTIARETSLTRRAVQKVLRRLLSKDFVFVDSTRARRSVVYGVDLDRLDRERYSQSYPIDREPGSQSGDDPAFSTDLNSEPETPPCEPGSPPCERRSPICEPGSPDPSGTVLEPSGKKYPAVANAPAVVFPDESKEERAKRLAITKRLAHETYDALGNDAPFADVSADLKDRMVAAGIPYDLRLVGVTILTVRETRRRRTA